MLEYRCAVEEAFGYRRRAVAQSHQADPEVRECVHSIWYV
ncbi:hypothetical protein GJR88_01678 [Dietzia sp. DQ12-45-1b]|nr:hypothetical protein GJR88_01678 [Dietzia sp. DQ12-45-1b]